MREEAGEELVRALKALLAYQLGRGAEGLLDGKVEVRRSPSTGRVREVYVNGVLVGTLRASDNVFVPTLRGAERLLKLLPHPRLRVVVPQDAAAYVARGRSVFCKHVLEADPEIRPGEEVLVVDEEGRLVAVGRAAVSGVEMVQKATGRAVKVRRGVLREK